MVTQNPDDNGLRGRIINVTSVMGLVASAGGAGQSTVQYQQSIHD